MNKKELQAITHAAAKNIKTEDDLKDCHQMLTKITVEAALNAELDDHLGFERHEQSEADNNRNGYASKTNRTEAGQFELDTPRDRAGSFEPKLVKKTPAAIYFHGRQDYFLVCPGDDNTRNRHDR